MSSCQVKGCTNNRKYAKEGISFHLFPKAGPILEKWLEAVGKEPDEWKWTKNMVVCSRHFTKDDFHKRGVRTVIHPTAFPSVNLDLNTDARIAKYNARSPSSSDDETEALNSSAQESDEEADSKGVKGSQIEFIESIHSYCVSPEMLEEQNSWLRGKLAYYRHALSIAKKQAQKLKLENTELKTALGYINVEQFVPEQSEENPPDTQTSDDLNWWNVSSCN
nr:unnamed protein product [Callosobruchus chinensis]